MMDWSMAEEGAQLHVHRGKHADRIATLVRQTDKFAFATVELTGGGVAEARIAKLSFEQATDDPVTESQN